MKSEFEEVAEAIRVEHEEGSDRLFIVFEVTNTKYKQFIKKNWSEDILFRVIDKKLVMFKE